MSYDGILLIDKPKGWTSFDVVAKIRGTLRSELRNIQDPTSNIKHPKVKVGHTGTLDPLATGLLVIVLGSYCKRALEFSKLDKTYEVTMKLGETSTTGDNEGEKTQISDKIPTGVEVSSAIGEFVGEIQQIPPAFSAIKIDGKRAYKLAREGKEVKLEPRTVTINNIRSVKYEYPNVSFVADVGSGTYIRSLVVDIGEKLQTGAYMTDLRRTKVGDFDIKDAQQINELNIDKTIEV